MRRFVLAFVSLVLLTVGPYVAAAAADWPSKPVKLIVAYGPGGGSDITARLLAQGLEKVTGKPFVVVNITGGAGWTGWGAIANANPDGNTIGYLNVPNLFSGYLDPRLKRAENLDSFTLIMTHVLEPCVWAVRADSPYKTLRDLIGAIKKSPGKLSITAHGNGGDDHLAYLDMKRITGIEMNVVHNNSTALSRSQLLGGHVDVLGANVSEVFQNYQSGDMVVLGIMDEKRSPFLPDVPTFKEQGYEAQWASIRVIAAPAGLPDATVKALTEVLTRVIESPEHRAKAKQLGLGLQVTPGAGYKAAMKLYEQRIKTLMGW